MVDEGADLLDVGGESSRPGHAPVDAAEEIARVVPGDPRRCAPRCRRSPISIDTTKPAVAEAALDAGADLLNDVWGVADGRRAWPASRPSAASPIVLMHNRAEARYVNLVAEVLADLQRALERALAAGVAWDHLIVDPGLRLRQDARPQPGAAARARRAPPPRAAGPARHVAQVDARARSSTCRRTSASRRPLATTALGIAAGVDIVRVHDVRANVRVARMADAIVRGGQPTRRRSR